MVPLGVRIRHFAELSSWESRLPLVEAKTSWVYGREAGSGNWVLPSHSRGAPLASGEQSVLPGPERDTTRTQTSARPEGDRVDYCEAGGLLTLQKSPSLEARSPRWPPPGDVAEATEVSPSGPQQVAPRGLPFFSCGDGITPFFFHDLQLS